MTAVAVFHQVRKTLPDGRVLLSIPRLELPSHACTLLTGENGAGKTTLLKILAGLLAPDFAEVQYRDQRMPWQRARRAYQADIIYLHQQPYLFDASVGDNIAYGLKRAGWPRAEIRRRVEEALQWSGLTPLAARNARRLSGGEQQRVALTRAWVLSPRALLLDEPLTSLDQEARERTFFLLQRMKSQGVGVVVTSHELEHLTALADRHLHLQGGMLHDRSDALPARRRNPRPAARDASHPARHIP